MKDYKDINPILKSYGDRACMDIGELRDETKTLLDLIDLYESAIDSYVSARVERYLCKQVESQHELLKSIVARDLW